MIKNNDDFYEHAASSLLRYTQTTHTNKHTNTHTRTHTYSNIHTYKYTSSQAPTKLYLIGLGE